MLNPDDKQKQISISITKIFNWQSSQSPCSFDLYFYPEDSDTPIIEKTVNGVFMSNSMNINSALKITYTDQESIVILKMMKNRKDKKQLLGQFQIDLDALREKNVQYFPFGKDHVLQVNLYVPLKAKSRSSRADDLASPIQGRGSRINSQARISNLRQPQKPYFYEKKRIPSRLDLNQRSRGYNQQYEQNPYQSRIKKSFSEKVFSLLQQVKSMKEDLIETSVNRVYKNEKYQPEYITNNQNSSQPRIKKSMSDSKFKSYGAIQGPASPTFRRQQQLLTKPTKIQKHRLILRTLNVVPCQQYYNKNDQKISPRNGRQENCRASSRNSGDIGGYNGGGNAYSNDYYYQSRLN